MGWAARANQRKLGRSQVQKITLPQSGLSGQIQRYSVQPVFKGQDPRNDMPVGGNPGRYRVVFTLARPGYAPGAEREFSFDPAVPGDSHLAIARPAVNTDVATLQVDVTIDGENTIFTGHPNQNGFLGRLETEILAADAHDAEVRASRAVASSLSNWSAHLDIPLWVWRTHVTDLTTQTAHITIRNPYLNAALVVAERGTLSKEFRAFASLYREACSTNSPAYEFLCLYKIAEGVRKRRRRLDAEMLRRGEKPKRASERWPDDETTVPGWLSSLFPVLSSGGGQDMVGSVLLPETRGRKVNDLLDKELNDVRDAIAHALSDESGEPSLIVDEALHLERVIRWLPVMKCVVRLMLKNEFPSEFLAMQS